MYLNNAGIMGSGEFFIDDVQQSFNGFVNVTVMFPIPDFYPGEKFNCETKTFLWELFLLIILFQYV